MATHYEVYSITDDLYDITLHSTNSLRDARNVCKAVRREQESGEPMHRLHEAYDEDGSSHPIQSDISKTKINIDEWQVWIDSHGRPARRYIRRHHV